MPIDFRNLLSHLISTPSVSSADAVLDTGNRPVAEVLASALNATGFCCELQPLPGNTDKVNLVATLGPRQATEGLVLAGHLDTVPCDEQGWDSDPFTLDERDGKLYGLGVSDMKGFLALAAETAAAWQDTRLSQPLTILATADEECGMDGARAFLDAGVRPGRHVVIGEPTGLIPIRQHKGILMESIVVNGASGHSSNPAYGVNAIEGMRRVLNALADYREALQQGDGASDFPVPHSTLNLGVLQGGDNPNRIPASCELQIDLRFTPASNIDSQRTAIRQRVADALADSQCRFEFKPLFIGTPAFETAASAPIVTACEQLTGHAAQAVDFGTEGAFFNQLGMDTVILGPGDISVAHQPNEYLGLERIEPMRKILHGLIQRFCLG